MEGGVDEWMDGCMHTCMHECVYAFMHVIKTIGAMGDNRNSWLLS